LTPRRNAELLIADVLSSLDKIERYIRGMSRKAFLSDEKTVDAVVRNLEIIGEAVRQLPAAFKQDQPHVPWAEMAGLRNRIVHDYAAIDVELILEICRYDLVPLIEKLQILSIM
jgi:uncharacterized protein with HEPN domain